MEARDGPLSREAVRMPAPHRRTTTQRGLGWTHQKHRAGLLRRHLDGTPCPCSRLDCGPGCPCRRAGRGLPMWRDPTRNVDGMALEADHQLARSRGGRVADRLLLATCNRSRGDGTRTYRPGGGEEHYRPPTSSRDW